MKFTCGFAAVVATICFCSASQSQNVAKSHENYKQIAISMDDDLHDRIITIRSGVKYTVQMSTATEYKYKLSISVSEASCTEGNGNMKIKDVDLTSEESVIHDNNRRTSWNCQQIQSFIGTRIYDSSTSTIEIIVQEWFNSTAKLLVTAFIDPYDSNVCPYDFSQCSECGYDDDGDGKTDDETKKQSKDIRCIPSSLTCNGRSNCLSCNSITEDESLCNVTPQCPECFWSGFHDTQYMLTILLAGLFFIMSPIVIVLVLFYHKRMSPSAREREILRARERGHANDRFTISQRERQLRNDRPPTYDDVHDTKTPPPNFHEVFPQNNDENANANTNTNFDIPQGPSSNV